MNMIHIASNAQVQRSETLPAMFDDGAAADYFGPRWYVAQTRSRHEKAVAQQLKQRNIEGFLPLYERVSRWKDRRVRLQLPLFDGYIFVRIPLCERLRALEIPGITRLVGFSGIPTAVADEEIDALRNGTENGVRIEPHTYLTVGRRVRIRCGPLAGLEGILVRRKGTLRVVVSVDLILRSIITDVDASDLQPLSAAKGAKSGEHAVA
jgi:transcription antitermination factor NusG